jgi:hypothetical protein
MPKVSSFRNKNNIVRSGNFGDTAKDTIKSIDSPLAYRLIELSREVASIILNYIPIIQKGAPNGVATLDGTGKLTASQVPTYLLGALNYQGTWDASGGTVPAPPSPANKGYYYIISVQGVIAGVTYYVGDIIASTGTTWERIDGAAESFLHLTDTPSSYTGQSLKAVRVNIGETALEFYTPAASPQYIYIVSTGAQLDTAVVALATLGGGIVILSGADFDYAPAANRNITNIKIIGATNGASQTKIRFTNANYLYGSKYELEGIGIDPFNAANAPFRCVASAGFYRFARLHHRGFPTESFFDAGNNTCYIWIEEFISGYINNSINVTLYAFIGSTITMRTGGTAYIDASSTVTGATSTTLLDNSSKVAYSNAASNLAATQVQAAIDELVSLLENSATTVLYVDGNRFAEVYFEDGSLARPYKTINAAVAVAPSGSIIKIYAMGAAYVEDITLSSASVTLQGLTGSSILSDLLGTCVYTQLVEINGTITINATAVVLDTLKIIGTPAISIANNNLTILKNIEVYGDTELDSSLSQVVVRAYNSYFEDIIGTGANNYIGLLNCFANTVQNDLAEVNIELTTLTSDILGNGGGIINIYTSQINGNVSGFLNLTIKQSVISGGIIPTTAGAVLYLYYTDVWGSIDLTNSSTFYYCCSTFDRNFFVLGGATEINLIAFQRLDIYATNADYNVELNRHTILVTTGAVDRTITLPLASDCYQYIINIKKVDAGIGKVIISPNGSNIDGSAADLEIISQNDCYTLHCDGIDWYII